MIKVTYQDSLRLEQIARNAKAKIRHRITERVISRETTTYYHFARANAKGKIIDHGIDDNEEGKNLKSETGHSDWKRVAKGRLHGIKMTDGWIL